jgi:hypothetical protein
MPSPTPASLLALPPRVLMALNSNQSLIKALFHRAATVLTEGRVVFDSQNIFDENKVFSDALSLHLLTCLFVCCV